MAQPQGFTVNGASNLISRLRRSLSGLKQSPELGLEGLSMCSKSVA
jgi:hypothetical protein